MSIVRTLEAALCAAMLCCSAVGAQTTGQQLAEGAGRGLVGSPAPALVVRTIDGQPIDLGSFYGKRAVYLKFWATWCGPCRKQMPHFEHVYETADDALAVIGVDVGFNDSLPEVRAAIAEFGLTMPTVIDDGALAAAFNLRVTPQHVVIGRDGRVAYIGHLADEKLDAALRAARVSAPAASGRPGAAAEAAIERYGIGDALPDLLATTLDGARVQLREPGDRRPTVLVFMSPWCETYYAAPNPATAVPGRPALAASCRNVREQVTALAKRTGGVRWLGVASALWSMPAELRDYEAKHALGIPLTMDESGTWFRAFDVMRVPTIVIADARGKVVRRIEGYDEALERALSQATGVPP